MARNNYSSNSNHDNKNSKYRTTKNRIGQKYEEDIIRGSGFGWLPIILIPLILFSAFYFWPRNNSQMYTQPSTGPKTGVGGGPGGKSSNSVTPSMTKTTSSPTPSPSPSPSETPLTTPPSES